MPAEASSTDGRGQDPENQLRQLREWCAHVGYLLAHQYVERENGDKGLEYRKQLGATFPRAARREFDLSLVWSLDRFGRERWSRPSGICSASPRMAFVSVIHGRALVD
jgi:DNA invertase Pin-like site-specific DNA recombinase